MANPLPASFLNFPIVDPKKGTPTTDFLRWLQQLVAMTANLNLNGTLNGGSKGQVDPATLAAQVANLDSNGVVMPNGVDLSRAYINKYLDYINDGTNFHRTPSGLPFVSLVPYNGNFEVFPASDVADGWAPNFESAGTGYSLFRSNNGFSGNYSQGIIGQTAVASRPIAVFAGKHYRSRVRCYSSVANPGSMYFRLLWYSDDTDLTRFASDLISYTDIVALGGPTAANTWQAFDGTAQAPAGAKFCRIALYNWSTSITLLFDTCTFGEDIVDLDHTADGSTYSRTLAAYVTSGVPYNYQGAWSSVTAYLKGAEVAYIGNYWLALANSTNSAPAVGNANWQLLGPTTLDNLSDGTTYGRLKAGYLSSGQLLVNEFPGAILNADGSISGANGVISSRTFPAPVSGATYVISMVGQKAASGDALKLDINSNGYVIYRANWQSDNTFVLSKSTDGVTYTTLASQAYGTSDTNIHSISITLQVGSPNSLLASIDGKVILSATDATAASGPLWLTPGATGKMWEFSARSDQIDTVRVAPNAVSQSGSTTGGVVVCTNVNQWYTGASQTINGGGVVSLVSFSAKISNIASVGCTINWQLVRGVTVVAQGTFVIANGSPPNRAYYYLSNLTYIDVGPPAGNNTYSLQIENTTAGTGTDVQFENSTVGAVSLNR